MYVHWARLVYVHMLDKMTIRSYNLIDMIAPEVFASFLFLPTFYKTEPASGRRCYASMPCMPGESRSEPQDTGLLYIAGEKIEGSGTLGQSGFVYKHDPNDPFFCFY